MNDDKNILGRVLALALLLGAVYGVESIVHGGIACPSGGGSSCVMAAPAPAVKAEAAPVEKLDAGPEPAEDEGAKLEEKAPVVPSATPK